MKRLLRLAATMTGLLIVAVVVASICGVRIRWTPQTMTVVVHDIADDQARQAARRILTTVQGITEVSDGTEDVAGVCSFECRAQRIVDGNTIQRAFAPHAHAWIREARIGLLEIDWARNPPDDDSKAPPRTGVSTATDSRGRADR